MIDREQSLLNIANYRNTKNVIFLLNNIYNLYKMGESGNQTAICIYMDLENALRSDKLTTNQRKCIYMKYFKKENNVFIGEQLNIDESTVRKNLHGGIKRLSKILEGDM
jgi:DNA-directed RNA polymerase specialized sigma subunit